MEAVVEYDYDAEQEDELTLQVGQVISNVQTAEGGWWEGELNGKKGMFPENFVKLLKRKEAPPLKKEEKREATQRKSVRELASKFKDGVPMGAAPPKKKENKKFCKVLFEYKKENEDELSLNVGELVEFHKQVEEGWWEGSLNGQFGVFPSNFVEMVEDEPQAPAAPVVEEKPVANTAPTNDKDKEPEFHTIKGKKVMGVGLGNIFGEGPIKLRATGAGSKKEEQHAAPVKEASRPSKPAEPEPLPAAAKREKPSIEHAIVRYSYVAEQPDELSLDEGKIIRIVDKNLEDEGWWKGEIDGKEGVFPDNFVELLPPEEPSKPKKPPPPSAAKLNNQPPKLPEKVPMGDSEDKAKTDTAPIKKAPGPPPIGKKPSSQKFGEATLPPGPKPDPILPAKPSGPGRGKEEPPNHVNHEEAGGFDNLESAGQKLTHLTASRAKGPKKRPPSTVLTLNEGEKEADGDHEVKVNNIQPADKPQQSFLPSKDSKHSSHAETSPAHHIQPPSASSGVRTATTTSSITSSSSSSSSSGHQHHRPAEPSTVSSSLHPVSVGHQSSSSSQQQQQHTNKLIEQLQSEIEQLRTNCVSRSDFNALRKEHEHLKSEFETLRVQHAKKLRVLMDEVDEEKKLRLSTQVEIERVKKLMAESNV